MSSATLRHEKFNVSLLSLWAFLAKHLTVQIVVAHCNIKQPPFVREKPRVSFLEKEIHYAATANPPPPSPPPATAAWRDQEVHTALQSLQQGRVDTGVRGAIRGKMLAGGPSPSPSPSLPPPCCNHSSIWLGGSAAPHSDSSYQGGTWSRVLAAQAHTLILQRGPRAHRHR